jgi:hypothetical protein
MHFHNSFRLTIDSSLASPNPLVQSWLNLLALTLLYIHSCLYYLNLLVHRYFKSDRFFY